MSPDTKLPEVQRRARHKRGREASDGMSGYSRSVAIGNYCAIRDVINAHATFVLPWGWLDDELRGLDGLVIALSAEYTVVDIERNQNALIVFL